MSIDLSPGRSPADLIDAIWATRRADRRDLLPSLIELLGHKEPTVREEAVSLVFVKWKEASERKLLENIIRDDSDEGVRARALGALAIMSEPATRSRDIETLRALVLDRQEAEQVRKAAYEALALLIRHRPSPIDDSTDIDEDLDLEWVRSL